jgi:DNA gyrase/topoisomerase IV subunit B
MKDYTWEYISGLEKIFKDRNFLINDFKDLSKEELTLILLKEILSNSIDEFTISQYNRIDIKISYYITLRDYGRGIPHNGLRRYATELDTSGKSIYDESKLTKTIGRGAGLKLVNALSDVFIITSIHEGKTKTFKFCNRHLIEETISAHTDEASGTQIQFKSNLCLNASEMMDSEMIHLYLFELSRKYNIEFRIYQSKGDGIEFYFILNY